jgi:uncharacterized protein (DUF58 family)
MTPELVRFWRRVRRFFEPPRQLRPTRLGWFFLGGALALGVAAVNTGNNLLYFVLGMFLAAIVVSGFISERNLRGLNIDRVAPLGATAGEPATVAFVVSRDARRLPALAVTVRDRDPETRVVEPAVRFARIDGEATRRRAYTRVFPSRGVARIEEVVVGTTFPFGLFVKSRRFELSTEVRVQPRLARPAESEAPGGREEGVAPAVERGEGFDLFGLRDHTDGDDARRIHWKATARLGRIVVKEPAREQPPQVVVRLLLDGHESPAAFEAAVSRAAGTAVELLEEGFGTGLLAGDLYLPPSASVMAREAILDALVDVAPGPDRSADRELPSRAAVVTVGPVGPLAVPREVASR